VQQDLIKVQANVIANSSPVMIYGN